MKPVVGALVLTTFTIAAAGCGGPTALDRGRAIFTRDCSSCHTLTGHETAVAGGDLAVVSMSLADLASFTRAMPVRLSPGEVRAVAAYVHASMRRG
ncbi:MAG: cytochrome c [Actinobacteria bacterium]|nr:cytochrome c [Actinomycetota bacterium]MBV8396123.1 cytochrome c [Actinomycetota bacterium]